MLIRPESLPPILVSLACAAHVGAADLSSLPWDARVISRSPPKFDSYLLPAGPFRDGEFETIRREGHVSRIILQADGIPSTLEFLNAIWSGYSRDGFELIFKCENENCGGFDFRVGIDVAEPPEMYVDLGDFRFLSASRRIREEIEYIAVLVSRSRDRGFAQVDAIGEFDSSGELLSFGVSADYEDASASNIRDSSNASNRSLSEELLANDRIVLEGLEFNAGSAELGEGDYYILEELAAFLRENPAVTIFLVGHTDNSGSMDANIKISEMRAASVLNKLVDQYGVDRSRLFAEGVGFLMPLAANSTEEGRNRNRRVEAVISTR